MAEREGNGPSGANSGSYHVQGKCHEPSRTAYLLIAARSLHHPELDVAGTLSKPRDEETGEFWRRRQGSHETASAGVGRSRLRRPAYSSTLAETENAAARALSFSGGNVVRRSSSMALASASGSPTGTRRP